MAIMIKSSVLKFVVMALLAMCVLETVQASAGATGTVFR